MNNLTERTTEQALDNAARAYANARATCAQTTPAEQARAAWTLSSPYTLEELEDRIRARRGMAARVDGEAGR